MINDVGIYVYLKEKGHHFYAAQSSWDCRLGTLTREQGLEEMVFAGDLHQVDQILDEIGYYQSPITDAVVIDKTDENAERYLCAYIVSKEQLTVQQVREYLTGELPGYMVPSRFIQVEQIPLTPNGKVDRRALQLLGKGLESGTPYKAPGTDVEVTIVDTWKEVLRLDKVGINDNYFDLGGTSFEIIRINSKLREMFRVDIPVAVMFRYTTVQALADYLTDEEKKIRDRTAALKRGQKDKRQMLQRRRGITVR
jgi:acyl carrier protein